MKRGGREVVCIIMGGIRGYSICTTIMGEGVPSIGFPLAA